MDMSDQLPMTPVPQGYTQNHNPLVAPGVASVQPPHSGGSMQKEIETGMGSLVPEIAPVREIGRDVDLPPEVVKAGVNLVPTTVQLPQPLVAAGVKPAGTTQPITNGVSVALPLTDDQISRGLKEHVSSSFRWLAEWCIRRIKQVQLLANKGIKT